MIPENVPQWKINVFITISLLILATMLFSIVYFFPRLNPLVENNAQDFELPTPTVVVNDPLVKPAGPIVPPIELIDPIKGSPDAEVTIIYFADFACPFCNEMHDVWQQVLDEYGDQVRIVWKDLLIYPSSLGLHKAARCAQLQGSFWEYYNQIWDYNFTSSLSVDLVSIAEDLDLDTEFFAQCLASAEIEQVVFGASQQALSVGVFEAPSYFIGDQFYDGYRDIEEIRELIDKQLGK